MTTFCPRCGQAGRDESVVMPLVSVWASCEHCHYVWRASLLDTVKDLAMRGARRTLGEKVVDRYAPAAPVAEAPAQPVGADRVAEWLASQEKLATLMPAPIADVPTEAGSQAAAIDAVDPVEAFFDRVDPAQATVAQHPASAPQHRAEPDAGEHDFYSFFSDVDSSQAVSAESTDNVQAVPHPHASLEEWIEEGQEPAAAFQEPGAASEETAVDGTPAEEESPAEEKTPAEDIPFVHAVFVDAAFIEQPVVREAVTAGPIEKALVEPIAVAEPVAAPSAAPAAATPLEHSVDRALTNVEDLYDAFKRLEQQLGGMEKWCAELANSR